jgi:hypothetical protein
LKLNFAQKWRFLPKVNFMNFGFQGNRLHFRTKVAQIAGNTDHNIDLRFAEIYVNATYAHKRWRQKWRENDARAKPK